MKICFYYPSYNLGGAQLLIYRVASELSKIYEIYIVDFENGFFANRLDGRIKLLVIKRDQQLLVEDMKYIVTFPSKIYEIKKLLRPNNNPVVFFWHVHPENFLSVFPNLRFQSLSFKYLKIITIFFRYLEFKSSIKLYDALLNSGSLVFMDKPNSDLFFRFYKKIKIEPKYLPVPLKSLFNKRIEYSFTPNKNQIHFFWVGRLSNQKLPALRQVIRDLMNLKINKQIYFSVVGKDISLFGCSQLIQLARKRMTVRFLGEIDEKNLPNILKKSCDLLFAMGTSALEGSRIGIPTILLDQISSNIEKAEGKYIWVHETVGYSLGKVIESKKELTGKRKLSELILEFIKSPNNQSIKAFQYFEENHEMASVIRKFLKLLDNSSFRFRDLNLF